MNNIVYAVGEADGKLATEPGCDFARGHGVGDLERKKKFERNVFLILFSCVKIFLVSKKKKYVIMRQHFSYRHGLDGGTRETLHAVEGFGEGHFFFCF